MKRILILSSAESETNIAHNDAFVAELNSKLGTEIVTEWRHYEDISLEFEPGKLRAGVQGESSDLSGYDLVYFKSYYRYSEQAVAIAECLKSTNRRFICSELEDYISFSKLSQYARMARAGLPIPKTLFVPRKHLAVSFESLMESLGDKFVFKATDAKGGDANYLISSRNEFDAAVAAHPDTNFVSQVFIPNDSDLRLLVLGGNTELVIKRQRKDNSTHLNNTSQGADAVEVSLEEITPDIKDLASRCVQLFHREVAGVDIMLESGTGKPYILEVNASPQVASGAETDRKIAVYCKLFQNML